jgi:tRNA-2-methylthio-N6-dimethylallyladenosine synthase
MVIVKEKLDLNRNISEIGDLTYHIMTFGCQMNQSDSERLSALLESYGYSKVEDIEAASLIIFNTCSIKQKAEDKVLGHMKLVRKLKKKNPNVIAGITGCMTRITSTIHSRERDDLLKRIDCLDFAFPIKDLPQVGDLLKQIQPLLGLQEIAQAEIDNYFKIQPKYETSFQAYIPIMTGCDKFCTYCIVPYSRGREMSRNIDAIYNEAVELVENGCKEITLLGQNVNSYGLSWIDKKSGQFTYDEAPFVQLMKKIDTIEGLSRLRFTSPHPQDMTPDVIDTIAEGRTLMPCIHLPLQSGSDEVLKKMNRNYDTAKFREIVEYIRKRMPDCTITTDMIVGFCGETEEQYEETYDFFKEMEFDLAYISQFSARKGTIADKLMSDDVDRKEKARRWHRLNDLLRESSRAKCKSFEGKTVKVLVEGYRDDKNVLYGRSEHYKEVLFEGPKDLVGEIVDVKITEAQDWLLEGVRDHGL